MLTSAPTRPPRIAYRPFSARVTRTRRLAPHFIRITFSGDEFGDFGREGLDQRIKLVLPLPGIGTSAFRNATEDPDSAANWYAVWRELPDAVRNPLRTYTVRAVRPDAAEIDVDFVVHGDTGPASAWATAAVPGDELIIVGPDAAAGQHAVGIAWQPGDASTFLLVGDETAAPAICSILESLSPDARGQAFIEIPDVADILPVTTDASLTVTWLPRGDSAPGSQLDAAVRAWVPEHLAKAGLAVGPTSAGYGLDAEADSSDGTLLWEVPIERPGSRLYAWLAGEAGAIKELRRFLVRDTGFDRKQVAFMGYWRNGKPETN